MRGDRGGVASLMVEAAVMWSVGVDSGAVPHSRNWRVASDIRHAAGLAAFVLMLLISW